MMTSFRILDNNFSSLIPECKHTMTSFSDFIVTSSWCHLSFGIIWGGIKFWSIRTLDFLSIISEVILENVFIWRYTPKYTHTQPQWQPHNQQQTIPRFPVCMLKVAQTVYLIMTITQRVCIFVNLSTALTNTKRVQKGNDEESKINKSACRPFPNRGVTYL